MVKKGKQAAKRTKQTKRSGDPEILDQGPSIVSSYVLLLAMFNEFIASLKAELRLTDEHVKDIFGDPYSSLKDTLLADTLIKQTLKKVSDGLEELFRVLNKIKEVQGEVKRLEDNEVAVDIQLPNLGEMERDYQNRIDDVKRLVGPLEELFQKQGEIDEEFALNCDKMAKTISIIFKEEGMKLSPKKKGFGLIKVINLLREQIALEDRLKRGEDLSEEDKARMQSIDTLCVEELLNSMMADKKASIGEK